MTGDTTAAETSEHNGVLVVRDDLYTGGTKARFARALFDGVDEVVYASPAEGGAQTALCTVAKLLGKRATIFVAKRTPPHPRVLESKRLGGKVMQVSPGYLTVVQARAKTYCEATGARLAPFGFDIPEAEETISQTALNTLAGANVKEVWCAYGSGTVMRALHKAFPAAAFRAVAVGRAPDAADFAFAKIEQYPKPFGWPCKAACPFPCDTFYDLKAWEYCARFASHEGVVFWNVAKPILAN